jgi:hypothetical protein
LRQPWEPEPTYRFNAESVGDRASTLPTPSALGFFFIFLPQGCANPGLELANAVGVSRAPTGT